MIEEEEYELCTCLFLGNRKGQNISCEIRFEVISNPNRSQSNSILSVLSEIF